MIRLPTKSDYEKLQGFDGLFCVSVYVPYIEPDTDTAANPNRIRLKNLLKETRTALKSAGVKERDISATVKPAQALVKRRGFWPPLRHESIVLFMHPRMFRYYYLPAGTTPYLMTVQKGFNLRPLRRVLENNRQYFVLALSHKNVRLYRGDRYGVQLIRLKNMPTDLKETLGIDEYPKWHETHTIAPVNHGRVSEAHHGQYNVSQTDKEMLLAFFRRIDNRVSSFLSKGHQGAPLIIAGVDYLLPIYRRINTYPGLFHSSITGNLERMRHQAIRQKAWALISSKSTPA